MASVTLRDLAAHTAGLPTFPDDPEWVERATADMQAGGDGVDATLDDLLDHARGLEIQSGQGFSYSNIGAALVGQAVASAADTDYVALLSERLLEPLDLDGVSVPLDDPDVPSGHAGGTDPAGNAVEPSTLGAYAPAGGIHATYLVDAEKEKLARYEALAALADEAIAALPEEANSHYRRAFAIGRYSQCISITKALAQGLAGKVKESLDATLDLAPKHAEAQTALGLYHAEIVGKVGGMLAKLTYGASAATAEKHLKEATKLTPDSPIAWIEYGNGLLLLHGEKQEDAVAEAYAKAAKLKPRDAMEALDAAWAKEQLA